MSLHHAAQHLAAQGRGPDETLVHMSNKEVAGLQAIAKMHGGSLTVNPKTGMTEAGFLDDIMPTLVGAAGMYFGIDPMTTAGIMGLGTAASTGDLGKGLTAGLGAYGGGNMMQGAMGSGIVGGAEAMPGATVPSATPGPQMIGADMEQMSAANLPDNIDAGGGYNPASGTNVGQTPITAENLGGWKNIGMAAAPVLAGMASQQGQPTQGRDQMIRPYTFAANKQTPTNMIGSKYTPGQDTSERQWFNPVYTAQTPYKAAAGGLMSLAAGGGPVEQMSNQNAIGANTQYPMADTHTNAFATPYQTPVSQNMLSGSSDTNVDPYTGEERFAGGGEISHLGGYSDGGRLLKGPGDGMSDNIPAQIGEKQPARLADGEFVVPADVVSHLGNGSTDAGAKHLYKMMDKVRAARTGNPKQGKQINANKFIPA
jgi:hypothetical protein